MTKTIWTASTMPREPSGWLLLLPSSRSMPCSSSRNGPCSTMMLGKHLCLACMHTCCFMSVCWQRRHASMCSTCHDVALVLKPCCCCILRAVQGCSWRVTGMSWHGAAVCPRSATCGRCRKPCLIIKPKLQTDSPPAFSIRLIPTIASDTFPLGKLAPDRNCLRLAAAAAAPATAAAAPAKAAAAEANSTAKGQKRKRADAETDPLAMQAGAATTVGVESMANATRLPTPQYNTSIIADTMAEQHQHVLQSALAAVPQLQEAIVLLKVGCKLNLLSREVDVKLAVGFYPSTYT